MENWEKRFDNDPDTGRAFYSIARGIADVTGKEENDIKAPFAHREKIKDFIRSLLAEQREEMAKKVREWKEDAHRRMMNEFQDHGHEAGAYSAFSDVLALLEELHTKK